MKKEVGPQGFGLAAVVYFKSGGEQWMTFSTSSKPAATVFLLYQRRLEGH
jgi:hypothetical protein